MRKFLPVIISFLMLGLVGSLSSNEVEVSKCVRQDNDPISLVVMDPLCDRLACDCVDGYAQRKYELLGEFLSKQLKRKVNVYWGESIQAALEDANATADLVVGKHSVVTSAAASLNLVLDPVAQLTGKDGSVSQTGLIVVRRDDPATDVADLTGYRIFFGPADCDEKYAAPMSLLRESGIQVPEKPEISDACSQAATKLIELSEDIQAAAVISSYAEPLLEGCGAVQKGDLRVIGVSDDVPFVSAFVNQNLPEKVRSDLVKNLMSVSEHPALLKALESQKGFVPFDSTKQATESNSDSKDSKPLTTAKKK